MSETLTQNLVFDVQFGAIRGDAQARSAIEDMASSAMGSGTIKGIRSSVGALERDMKRVMASAFKGGLRQEGRELYKVFQEGAGAIVKAREQVSRIDNQLLTATDRAHRGRLQRERNGLRQEIQSRTAAVENRVSLMDAQASRQADMLETASRNAAKNWKQSVEKSGEAFSSMVDGALNMGSTDPAQAIQGFGKKYKSDMAPKLAEFGAKNAGKGGAMGGLGKAAAALGAAGAAIAGAAAAIGALVAIFAAAYGQTKKLNSALLEGTTAADMLDTVATKGRNLEGRLTELREAALGTAYAFRMSGEEVSQMISQISDSGMQINEWKDYTQGAVDSMDSFATVTHQAFVASKSFGTSVSEIGGFTATMFHEMGKGLDRVGEGFRMIFAGAQRSSMSTKQFFTSISEASSGMALYNFRLDDTVGLLLEMTSVLGEDLAASQTKMSGTYRNMSQEQRVQTVMNAGGAGVARGIQAADLTLSIADFDKDIARTDEDGNPAELAEGIATAMAGVLTDGGLDAGKLGSMSEKDFGAMLYKLREEDGGDPIAMQLENMVGLARGSQSSGVSGAASGMAHLSRQGELAQQLMEASTLLGGGISTIEGLSVQAYENVTGRSGEDFEILKRIDRQMRAEFDATGGAETNGKFETWVVGALGDNATVAAEAVRAQPIMERLARDQMMETRSISQTLKNVIASALEGIWSVTLGIFSWGKESLKEGLMRENETATDVAYTAMEGIQDDMATQQDIIFNPDSTTGEVAGATAALEGYETSMREQQQHVAALQRDYRKLASGGYTKEEMKNHGAPQLAVTRNIGVATQAEVELEGTRSHSQPQDTANDLTVTGRMARLRGRVVQHNTDSEGAGITADQFTPEALSAYLNANAEALFPHTEDNRFSNQPRYFATQATGSSRHIGPGRETASFQNEGDDPLWSGSGGMPQGVVRDISASTHDGRGFTVRPFTIADLTESQMVIVADALVADGAAANFAAASPDPNDFGPFDPLAPTPLSTSLYPNIAQFLNPQPLDGGLPGLPGLSEDLLSTNEDISSATTVAGMALDAMLGENQEFAETGRSMLGVEEDQRTLLKTLVQEVSNQGVSYGEMMEMSGMGTSDFITALGTEEGRGRIGSTITRRGESGVLGRNSGGAVANAVGALAEMNSAPMGNDIIWRAGQGAMRINPNDTVRASLRDGYGADARGGGGGTSISIYGGDQSVVYNTVRRAMKSQGR